VAGDHAINDMAGDEEDSWKSIFEKAGFKVECILKGLGEFQAIRDIYLEHIAQVL
jgi:sirohydrochlorin cobaltochelatase